MVLVIAGYCLKLSYLPDNNHKTICSVKFHYYWMLQCLDGKCCLVYLHFFCLTLNFFVIITSSLCLDLTC